MSLSPAVFAEAPTLAALAPYPETVAASPRRQRVELDIELNLRHAGRHRLRLRAELIGPARAPLLLVAGGISANRRVCADPAAPGSGWWSAQAGPGRSLDTERYQLLAFDWLGADGSLDVAIDSSDQADALAALLDHLGIQQAQAFIGASYGAMVGLQFAARHGHRLRQLVAISGVHRPHPYASAWRALQRQVVRLGRSEAGAARALSLARQWALLSYRTPEEFATRFAQAPALTEQGIARCAAEDYLAHNGAAYAARWSSTAFLRLSESIDLHRVEPESIRVPTTVIAVAEDRLVPLDDAFELCERLGQRGILRVLRSQFGHDAFLKEETAIAALLREALTGPTGAGA